MLTVGITEPTPQEGEKIKLIISLMELMVFNNQIKNKDSIMDAENLTKGDIVILKQECVSQAIELINTEDFISAEKIVEDAKIFFDYITS